jgi:diguanylate cyclase (GGDEF)-like protein
VAATTRSGLIGALFFIDLDNFKALNDTRGHDVGDQLLVEVAQRLRAAVREGDTVARQGGDEFVVLMEDLGTELDEAAALASQLGDKLRDAIDRPFELKGYDYHCKISIGVGLFDKKETGENLFKHADLALYQAKNAGRNTLRFFDPAMQEALDLRSALEAELRLALKRQELQLYYQPQVDGTQRVIGVEALLRWQHPERGLVSPNDFIPLAEDSGLILPIGLWVLETACALLKSWEEDACTRELTIAVNVSARQFRQPDFVEQVQQVLETSRVNPARLKLELTESLVLEDVKDTVAKIEEIKHLGVSFAMDDFGTGYSSLSYLTRLPIDQLKIDRSFVSSLPGPKSDETIARTIITMGGGLDMHVIAEGVETEEQRLFLEAHGCHAYQGYFFSRPLPLEKLDALLKKNTRADT